MGGDDSRDENGGGSGDDRGSDLAGGETTRITREGQVTIPKRFREEFGLEEGDELLWEKTEDGITVRKATQSAGRGMLVDDVPEAPKRYGIQPLTNC